MRNHHNGTIFFLTAFSVTATLFVLFSLSSSSYFAYAEKYQDNSFGYSMNIPDEYLVTTPFHDVLIISSENPNHANGVDSINVLVVPIQDDDKSFHEMINLVKNDLENFGNEVTEESPIELGHHSINHHEKKAIMIKSYTNNIGVPIFFENVIVSHVTIKER